MKRNMRLLFCIVLACCLAPCVFSQTRSDTLLENYESRFLPVQGEINLEISELAEDWKDIVGEKKGADKKAGEMLEKKYSQSIEADDRFKLGVFLYGKMLDSFVEGDRERAEGFLKRIGEIPAGPHEGQVAYLKGLAKDVSVSVEGKKTDRIDVCREVVDLYGRMMMKARDRECYDHALNIYRDQISPYRDTEDFRTMIAVINQMTLAGAIYLYDKKDEEKACSFYIDAVDWIDREVKAGKEHLDTLQNYRRICLPMAGYCQLYGASRRFENGRFLESDLILEQALKTFKRISTLYDEGDNFNNVHILGEIDCGLLKAKLLVDQGKSDLALAYLDNLEKRFCDYESFWIRSALLRIGVSKIRMHEGLGNVEAKMKGCREVIERALKFESDMDNWDDEYGRLFRLIIINSLGAAYNLSGHADQALEILGSVENCKRDGSWPMDYVYSCCVNRQIVFFETGDFDKSIELGRQMLGEKLVKNNFELPSMQLMAGCMLVYAFKEQGRHQEALEVVRKLDGLRGKTFILRAVDKMIMGHFNAYMLSRNGRKEEARQIYEKLTRGYEALPRFEFRDCYCLMLLDRAELEKSMGNQDVADDLYRKIAGICGPSDAPLMKRIGEKVRALLPGDGKTADKAA